MKKLFLSVLSLLLIVPLYSQTLAYRHDEDSYVQVATNYYYEGKGAFLIDVNPRTAVSLFYHLQKDNGEEIFNLDFLLKTYHLEFSFDKNAKVYIKTFQDKLITLHQKYTNEEIRKDREQVSDHSDSFYYYVYPSYFISKDDLQTIMNEGIKKMSFMTTRGYHVLSFENDTLGKIITDEYNILLGKSDFTEGF